MLDLCCRDCVKYKNILSHVTVTKTRFWIGNWIINNLPVVPAINYCTIATLHNVQSLHTNIFSLSALVFTNL
jgi:hypothetical protein